MRTTLTHKKSNVGYGRDYPVNTPIAPAPPAFIPRINPQPDPNLDNAVALIRQRYAPTPTPGMSQVTPTPGAIPGFTTWSPPSPYVGMVMGASQKYGVDPAILAAVIQNENGGWSPDVKDNPNKDEYGNVVSTDRGFVQINDKAHPHVSYEQARDPQFAIDYAASLIANNNKRLNNLPYAIAAYNVGAGRVGPGGGRDADGFGPKAKEYLNKAVKNLSPEVRRKYGFKDAY